MQICPYHINKFFLLTCLASLIACSDNSTSYNDITESKDTNNESAIHQTIIKDSVPLSEASKTTDIENDKREIIIDEPKPIMMYTQQIIDSPVSVVPSAPQELIIYDYVDETPRFKSGETGLDKFLSNHLEYPETMYLNNISGTTIVQFVIDINGHISKIKVEKSSGYSELDQEAMRVIKLTNGQWIPGKVNGKVVNTYNKIPISFMMNKE